MKLLNKISRYYIINSSLFMIIAFVAVYFALNWIIQEEIDEELLLSHGEIVTKLKQNIIVSNPPFIEVERVSSIKFDNIVLSDTTVFLADEQELEPFRQATSYFQHGDSYFKLTIRASLIDENDLVVSLLIIFLLVTSSMFIILYFVNRKTTKEIFRPFYNNLESLKKYSVKLQVPLELQESNIDEFMQLNKVLGELSDKAGREYNALREFSEDLSHELQTPVSIIKNKLELLIQKDINDEEMIDSIQKSYKNINKLDRLNRSLILLSKLESIDNFETNEFEPKELIEKIISNYSDAAELKKINITSKISDSGIIKRNETLMDILLGNLISNAIRHNYEKGKIEIKFIAKRFTIKNTSNNPPLKDDAVFSRFNKNSKLSGTVGLGLSIAKKICDLNGFKLSYSYDSEMHCFIVDLLN